MAVFKMEYASIQSLAAEIHQMEAEFTDTLTELDHLMGSLDSTWKGKAYTEFATAFHNLRPTLDEIGDVLTNYKLELDQAVEREQSLESISSYQYTHIHF